MVGKKFHRFTVVALAPYNGHEHRWVCKCTCGASRTITGGALRRGDRKSCGCYREELKKGNTWGLKHGHNRRVSGRRSRTHVTWASMLGRCYQKSNQSYPRYGGLGIKVCKRWQGKNGFANFLADMGERPEGKTLDRVNSRGDYKPSNCRWATVKEQNENRGGIFAGEEPILCAAGYPKEWDE